MLMIFSFTFSVKQDVLVISQFVKPDGEVIQQHVTGLCNKAHRHLKKIALRAQRAGKPIHVHAIISWNISLLRF